MLALILVALVGLALPAIAKDPIHSPIVRGCDSPEPLARRAPGLHALPTTGSPEEPFLDEARELLPVTYHSWQENDYAMFAFDGRYVRVFVQTNDFPLLGKARMHELVDRCDRLYSTMRDLLAWEPGGDGRLSIALAVDTCGSGCGFVGGKGIEVEVDFHAYGAERIDDAYGAVWSILIHEMAHNFDPVSGPVFYTSDTAHAWTSFLNFYVMVADGNGTLEHGPSFERPRDVLNSMVEYFFDPYVRDVTSTWEGCISGGDCAFPSPENGSPAKQRGAQGGLFLKFAQVAGDAALHRMLRHLVHQVMVDPGAWVNRSPQDKADLVVEAMSVAAGGSLAPVMDRWKWAVSPATRAALSAAFGDPPAPALDRDGDGFTPAEGDCDDEDPTRHPRVGTSDFDLLPPCPDPATDLAPILEDGDFPGFGDSPVAIVPPVLISGDVQFEGDIDRFSFQLEKPSRLRFTLTSLDSWDGWCLFDHTRIYAVRALAGQSGALTVRLGPGAIGIRMESVDGRAVGRYRLGIEVLPDEVELRWIEPTGDCTPYPDLPVLLETADAPDYLEPLLGDAPVPVRLPGQIVGRICPGDEADWYSLRLDEPTWVRINLFSHQGFAGWVFRPTGGLAYCPKGSSGGGLHLFPAGTNTFRVVAQNHVPAPYRVVLQREETAFFQPAPPPIAASDGTWTLLTGPLPAEAAAADTVARFWVSGLGWIGSAPLRDGETSLTLRLPVDADSTALSYRFQLFRAGTPVSPITPSRPLGPIPTELPLDLRAADLTPSVGAATYDATFEILRSGDRSYPADVSVLLDGQSVLSFAAVPARFTLRDLKPGVHAVHLAVGTQGPASALSRSYPFAIFHSPELNAQDLVPNSRRPMDLRNLRRVRSLAVESVPPPADLDLFEALEDIAVRGSVREEVRRLLAVPHLRHLSAPTAAPVLALTPLPGQRVRVRGFAFGRLAVLQQSADLLTWTEVPYSGNAGPDEVLEADLPAGPKPQYFRLRSL